MPGGIVAAFQSAWTYVDFPEVGHRIVARFEQQEDVARGSPRRHRKV
jgi:hypothetical protein